MSDDPDPFANLPTVELTSKLAREIWHQITFPQVTCSTDRSPPGPGRRSCLRPSHWSS